MTSIVLANYQRTLVDGISLEIANPAPATCVLLAPTGSGKTLILGRALSQAAVDGAMAPTIWLWVAPLEVIVDQTSDTLYSEAGPMVHPRDLATQRSIVGHAAGDVWLTTTAYLTNNRSNLQEDSERSVSLRTFIASIRAQGFRVGLVIDEAHIAADSATRFGEVMRDLVRPDVVIAATATPKDARLEGFLSSIGQTRRRNFSVTRSDVVREHLNKESLRVLRLVSDKERANIDQNSLLDLLVKRAWSYNQEKADALSRNDIGVTPLMLVQVENGSDEGRAMQARIMRLCNLTSDEVALYFDSEKSHGSLSEIARNPQIKVLVFKVAAGTGFDAPRAFVLASTRTSQDSDAALQFIGRIMRVDREIRAQLYAGTLSDLDREILDSGRLVVLDDESQAGFRKASDLIKGMRRDIDPDIQSIEFEAEILVGGEHSLTIADDLSARSATEAGEPLDHDPALAFAASPTAPHFGGAPAPSLLHGGAAGRAATIHSVEAVRRGPSRDRYDSFAELQADLHEQGLEARRLDPNVPAQLTREAWPGIASAAAILPQLASAILPDMDTIARLIPSAIGERDIQLRDSDVLGAGKSITEIERITNRDFAADHAMQIAQRTLDRMPGLEDRAVRKQLVDLVVTDVRRKGAKLLPNTAAARPVAHLLIADREQDLIRAQSRAMIGQASSVLADTLPRILIVPLGLGEAASKSGYGFTPGMKDAFDDLDSEVLLSLRAWRSTVTIMGPEGEENFTLTPIDQDWAVNETEKSMVDLLERHEHVAWWLRNPARKSYAVSILKLDGRRGFFYPDFVIGTTWDGTPRQQLAETKYDQSDIDAKMQRGPTLDYGRVIFVRLFNGRLHIVENDGSVGTALSADSLDALTDQMRHALLA